MGVDKSRLGSSLCFQLVGIDDQFLYPVRKVDRRETGQPMDDAIDVIEN